MANRLPVLAVRTCQYIPRHRPAPGNHVSTPVRPPQHRPVCHRATVTGSHPSSPPLAFHSPGKAVVLLEQLRVEIAGDIQQAHLGSLDLTETSRETALRAVIHIFMVILTYRWVGTAYAMHIP